MCVCANGLWPSSLCEIYMSHFKYDLLCISTIYPTNQQQTIHSSIHLLINSLSSLLTQFHRECLSVCIVVDIVTAALARLYVWLCVCNICVSLEFYYNQNAFFIILLHTIYCLIFLVCLWGVRVCVYVL